MRTIEIVENGGMSDKEFQEKKDLTQRIIRAAQSVFINVDSDMFFSLAFCDVKALKKIAKQLGA